MNLEFIVNKNSDRKQLNSQHGSSNVTNPQVSNGY